MDTLVSSALFKSNTLQAIGTDAVPDYKERANFPFTCATILETLRINTVGRLLMTQFVLKITNIHALLIEVDKLF